MLRRLFTLAAAASLVLCVAVCVLWVWSGSAIHEGQRTVGGYRFGIRSYTGQVEVWEGVDPCSLFSGRSPFDGLDLLTLPSPQREVRTFLFDWLGVIDQPSPGLFALKFPHGLPGGTAGRRDGGNSAGTLGGSPTPGRPKAVGCSPPLSHRPLPRLWIRPPRHPRPVPGVRQGHHGMMPAHD